MSPDLEDPEADAWLSLQEASAILGVAASTLRRWGDRGKVSMKRTLGGHRRFSRRSIDHLAGRPMLAEPAAQEPAHLWGVDERELARQEWHARLASRPTADRMRGLGQRLLGLLMQYINRRDDRFLSDARDVGVTYGREARVAGINMHDTVEAFLFFRATFSQLAMPLPGVAHPADLAEAAALHARIERFMDAILLGVIAGYEQSQGSGVRGRGSED